MMPFMGQQPVAGAHGTLAGGDVMILGAGFRERCPGDCRWWTNWETRAWRLLTSAETGGFLPAGSPAGRLRRGCPVWPMSRPYLSVGENLENQALFERFSDAIATVLGENVAAALASGCPAWQNEFIRVAHQRRATLVMFNYDPLIECAVATGLAWPRSSGRADRILARLWCLA